MKWMRNVVRALMAWMLMATLAAQAQSTASAEYILGAADVLRISVFQNPDMTLETVITETGEISFPLIGSVKVGGLTRTKAEKLIETRLKDGNFLKQPQVSILVLQYKAQSVSVLGQVNRPGRYPLDPKQQTLSQLIATAGGTILAAGSDVVVVTGTRNGEPFRREIDFPKIFAQPGSADDLLLQDGDSIWVDRAPQVYVYGEVQRPGTQILMRDQTLLQALAAAGGLTLRGTERGIQVHRRQPDGTVKIIKPDVTEKLQKDDVVYVKESLF